MRIRISIIENIYLLTGIVEMDEGFVGGKSRKNQTAQPSNIPSVFHIDHAIDKPKRGRGIKKTPVVGMVSRGKDGKVATQVSRNLLLKNYSKYSKAMWIRMMLLLITDDFKSYKQFRNHINHIIAQHSKQTGAAHTKNIDNFFRIIKNGIKGIYKSIPPKYLPLYLTEYGYKYILRNIPDDFKETIQETTETKRSFKDYKPKTTVDAIVFGKTKKKTVTQPIVKASTKKVIPTKKKVKT